MAKDEGALVSINSDAHGTDGFDALRYAIGLSEARRAGIKLGVPQKGSKTIRQKAAHDTAVGQGRGKPDAARSRGAKKAARTRDKRYGRS